MYRAFLTRISLASSDFLRFRDRFWQLFLSLAFLSTASNTECRASMQA